MPASLLSLSAKVASENLENLSDKFFELSYDLKEMVLRQLNSERLFAFWRAHYAEDHDLPVLALNILKEKTTNNELQKSLLSF